MTSLTSFHDLHITQVSNKGRRGEKKAHLKKGTPLVLATALHEKVSLVVYTSLLHKAQFEHSKSNPYQIFYNYSIIMNNFSVPVHL